MVSDKMIRNGLASVLDDETSWQPLDDTIKTNFDLTPEMKERIDAFLREREVDIWQALGGEMKTRKDEIKMAPWGSEGLKTGSAGVGYREGQGVDTLPKSQYKLDQHIAALTQQAKELMKIAEELRARLSPILTTEVAPTNSVDHKSPQPEMPCALGNSLEYLREAMGETKCVLISTLSSLAI